MSTSPAPLLRWLDRQWRDFDRAWRGIGRTELLWTFAVALTFTVAHAYALNLAPGRSWPIPIRIYEWTYIPASLAFIVAFRFAEQSPGPGLWWRYALVLPVASLAFGQVPALLAPFNHEQHSIDGWAAFMWGSMQSLVISAIGAVVYSRLSRSRRAQLAFEAMSVQRAGSQRRVSAARLAAQQARLDPAFLFSSLDLVQGLYERDPASAEATLQNLIDYLRTALPVLEGDGSTVAREVRLARLYLEIVRARLGSRLSVAIDVPADLEGASFPPMISVPLVELVVRLGLEPVPHGGSLRIHASRHAGRLELAVDHAGIAADPTDVGFAVLRERLAQHYGAAANLVVASAAGGGHVAITVPDDTGTTNRLQ